MSYFLARKAKATAYIVCAIVLCSCKSQCWVKTKTVGDLINRDGILSNAAIMAKFYDRTNNQKKPGNKWLKGYHAVQNLSITRFPLNEDNSPFTITELMGQVLENKKDRSKKLIIIRGTTLALTEDIQFGQARTSGEILSPAKVEQGFFYQYLVIRDTILEYLLKNPASEITIMGHSLGSAIAIYLTYDILSRPGFISEKVTPQVFLFAPPRPGNVKFMQRIRGFIEEGRLKLSVAINRRDVVPVVPPSTPFAGTYITYPKINSMFLCFSGKGKIGGLLGSHAMKNYNTAIRHTISNSDIPGDLQACNPSQKQISISEVVEKYTKASVDLSSANLTPVQKATARTIGHIVSRSKQNRELRTIL